MSDNPTQQKKPLEIPDGRRNSQGEALKSPVATWKPSLGRVQSWDRQEMKRELQRGQVEGARGAAGYTENGEREG